MQQNKQTQNMFNLKNKAIQLAEAKIEENKMSKSPKSISSDCTSVNHQKSFNAIPNNFRASKAKKDWSSSSSDDNPAVCKCIFDNSTNTISNKHFDISESKNACSKICKYLSPEDQRKIILKNTEFNENLSENNNNGENYIISSKWWEKWCQFVNIDFKPFYDLLSEFNSTDINKLPDTIDISVDFGSAKNTPRPNEQVPISTLNIISMDEFKQRPPKIMNCQIVSFDSNSQIVYSQEESITISSRCWTYLKRWYGCDIEVQEKVEREASQEKSGHWEQDTDSQSSRSGGLTEEEQTESEQTQEEQQEEEQSWEQEESERESQQSDAEGESGESAEGSEEGSEEESGDDSGDDSEEDSADENEDENEDGDGDGDEESDREETED